MRAFVNDIAQKIARRSVRPNGLHHDQLNFPEDVLVIAEFVVPAEESQRRVAAHYGDVGRQRS